MSISRDLAKRSDNKCELCHSTEQISAYTVPPKSGEKIEDQIVICNQCKKQINEDETLDINHWRCLNDSMWNAEPAVQVMSYRMLHKLNSEGWAQDAINMIYMEPETLEWAQEGIEDEEKIIHKDSNGNILENGDTVTLIQDLNVKGGGFTAKRGTAVRRIRLTHDNPEHIEGKVDGQQIVILTKYVKKQSEKS